MEKRYTLPVAIALVVGTVIGSGVFFKAEAVLTKTGGNLSVGILAFIIMGVVMIISACTFGVVAQSHEGVEGLVGYAAASCGKTYSYYVGWFMAVIYYPSLVSVLSWLPARYFGVLMGWDDAVVGGRTMMLAGVFMVVTYTMNALAPKLAGKFAICTTVIKLIPLLLMAVVGTIVGLSNGMTEFNFSNVVTEMPFTEGLFGAIVSLAFAFEGWICATSIGTELKDSKKNMPRALLIGTVIVAIVYVIYYIGLAGAVESEVMMAGGEAGAKIAFQNIFGQVGGAAIFVFVVISCWGTCNGLTMAVTPRYVRSGHREQQPQAGHVQECRPQHQHGQQLRRVRPAGQLPVAAVLLRRHDHGRLRALQVRLLRAAHHHPVRHLYPHLHRAAEAQGSGRLPGQSHARSGHSVLRVHGLCGHLLPQVERAVLSDRVLRHRDHRRVLRGKRA